MKEKAEPSRDQGGGPGDRRPVRSIHSSTSARSLPTKMASQAQQEVQTAKAIVGEYQEALGIDKGADHDHLRRALGSYYSPEITWYGMEPFNVLTGNQCSNLNKFFF